MPGVLILPAPVLPTKQSTAPHSMRALYNNAAACITLTITYTVHCDATDQLISMPYTAAPSPWLVAGVEPALAA